MSFNFSLSIIECMIYLGDELSFFSPNSIWEIAVLHFAKDFVVFLREFLRIFLRVFLREYVYFLFCSSTSFSFLRLFPLIN